jgi:hypothetical protein
MFFAVYVYFASGIFSKEHAVIDFHVERSDFAVITDLSFAYGNNLSFLRLLLGGIRDDDATLALLLLLDTLHNDAILQRPNFHLLPPFLFKLILFKIMRIGIRRSGSASAATFDRPKRDQSKHESRRVKVIRAKNCLF